MSPNPTLQDWKQKTSHNLIKRKKLNLTLTGRQAIIIIKMEKAKKPRTNSQKVQRESSKPMPLSTSSQVVNMEAILTVLRRLASRLLELVVELLLLMVQQPR